MKSKPSIFTIIFLALLSGLFGLRAAQPARAAGTLYAKPGATGDCSNWASACNLSTALTAASPGDEIWVAQGVHIPTTTSPDLRTATFQLKNDVTLYGGFIGDETARNQRDLTNNVTILSGDLDGNDLTDPHGVVTSTTNITGTNAYHVVTGSNVTTTAILDGFTITAGLADASEPNDRGGGMYNDDNGSPSLTNVTFSGNQADYGGGGMCNSNNSNPSLTNVSFSGNQASSGGGMYNNNSSPSLTNASFSGNQAGSGGGMYNNNSSPTLIDVTFNGNTAYSSGGGMNNLSLSNPKLTDVIFSNNKAKYGGGMHNHDYSGPQLTGVTFSSNSASEDGGGMYNSESDGPTLTNVTFSGNSADNCGGGIYNVSSNPTLTHVTFSGNSADDGGGVNNESNSSPTMTNITFSSNEAKRGGGMYNVGSSPTLTNISFSSNSAEYGGGMYNADSSTPNLTNITFSDNQADTYGGGIYNNSSNPTLSNTILWGNQANLYAQIRNDNSAPNIHYSLIQDGCPAGSTCDHLLTTNPLFVDAAHGNLRLQATSPAIDAGDNTTPGLSGITTDLDGNSRFVDIPTIADSGNGNAPIVDMGAYETRRPTTTGLVSNPNPVHFGQEVTFTATVTATSGTPGGSVRFYDAQTLLGTSALDSNNVTTFTTAALSVGTHTITAQYEGNATFAPSTSAPISQVINSNSIYLPLALKDYVTYFKNPWESEPNNDYQHANGPLNFGQMYYAYPNDAKDYFSIYLPKAAELTVEMSGHTGDGVQMLLYYQTPVADGEVARAYSAPYTITHHGTAGWYYIYIYTAGRYNSSTPYALRVNVPTNITR